MAEEVEDPKPHAADGAPQSHEDSSGDSAAQPPPAAGAGGGGGGGIGGFSLSIWPPTQRTRDAVIRRLVENLTSSTVLSKRYGVVPPTRPRSRRAPSSARPSPPRQPPPPPTPRVAGQGRRLRRGGDRGPTRLLQGDQPPIARVRQV
uniref:WPP domain-containing protein n=1 Tax=Ananas comosus var. bracteatus TaxID=296719 RepID=A0A6V7PNA5_ANACO|nr:unnamed protein product [Ananas comosus var. bracteatus]